MQASPRGRTADDGARSLPPWALIACAAALVLVVFGTFAQRTHAILPFRVDAGELVRAGAQVGEWKPRSADELRYLVQTRPPGERLGLGPAGSITPVPELEGVSLWITLVNALAFWCVCAFFLVPRLRLPGIRDLFACLLLASIAIGTGGVSPPRGAWQRVLPLAFVAAFALMPAFFVRFTSAFPRPLALVRRRAWVLQVPFVVSIVLALWCGAAWLACFAAPGSAAWDATRLPTGLTLAFVQLGGLVGIGTLAVYGRLADTARERRQAKWILWCVFVGMTPYVLMRGLPRLLGIPEPGIPPLMDRIVEMLIPTGFAIAVVKERFLDIDVIIRRSLLYTLLAAGGALVFFVTGVLLGERVADWVQVEDRILWAVAGALTGLLFPTARRLLGRVIDRAFFRIRFEHEQALETLQRTLAQAGGQAELARRLDAFLDGVLEPRTHGAIVVAGDDLESAGSVRTATFERMREALVPVLDARPGPVARPGSTACPEIETAAFPEAVAAQDFVVVQPVRLDGALRALVLLGPRETERRYVQEDVELLTASAREVATALERLELVQRVAEEAVQRKALAELTRQKSDFFARLAHDLRTPVAAVRWSTRNLLDGLPGPLTDRQTLYLEGVEAAAGRLVRLVDNLVDLGRIDLKAPERPPEPVDLGAVVDEVVKALRALADERRVRIEVAQADALPPARGRSEAAFQVVINLIDNALKHAPPETTVEVDLHPEESWVVLVVRDHGPGLPDEGRDELFELFRQGGDEGERKKGYGIGLYIVRQWMRSMGGTVSADDPPAGGARFTCRFPRWTGEENLP